jgi:mannosyl-oligosaccharide glucosidase
MMLLFRWMTARLVSMPRDPFPFLFPYADEERHVDLRCWMALAARLLAGVGEAAGASPAEVSEFAATAKRLADYDELKALHWDEQRHQFADWGLHTEDVALLAELDPDGRPLAEPIRQNTGAPPKLQFVPHHGYVSLFPLLMGLVPADAPELGHVLSHLKNPRELWTPAGLRSLSATSSMYQRHNTPHDPPYWRGAVWINMNYVALRALRGYALGKGPYAAVAAEAAQELRNALLRLLVGQYVERGYLYEQYDDVTGQGKGSQPFTGWTALLTLIADERKSSALWEAPIEAD